MTFYTPLAFIFLLAVPVIIILYLLKQRHRDYTVSSLYLWEEVLKDMEANAPWQKLRKNLLMMLQILAMLLLVFALSRPFLNFIQGKTQNAVIILDTSLSMQAEDVKPNRFEEAKTKALDYMSGLKPGTLVTLISMGSNAVIEENLNPDLNEVRNKLKNLRVTNGTADIEDAANLADSIVKQHPDARVLIFGDNSPESLRNMTFVNVGRGGGNHAVTLLSHSYVKGKINVLSTVANYSEEKVELPVTLFTDGKVYDARRVVVEPRDKADIYWGEVPEKTIRLECRIESKDCLSADNSAFDSVNNYKPGKVLLVSEKNVFIEKALRLIKGVQFFRTTYESAGDLKGYDMYIFDGFIPQKLPDSGNVMVFNPVENPYFKVNGISEFPVAKKSANPLFTYINDYSFVISKARKMEIPSWGDPVLDSDQGPLIFSGEYENKRILVAGFDLHSSDLPLKPAFPIFMNNALEWLMPAKIKNIGTALPFEALAFNLHPKARHVRVVSPTGETFTLAPPFPAGVFDRTSELGNYTLEQNLGADKTFHFFSINPPTASESDLQARNPSIKADSAAAGRELNQGYNLQWILLWLLLAILLIEWWFYTNGV